MARKLTRDEIIGCRLQRILQTYQLLDDWLDHTDHTFVLESGVAFRLPGFSDEVFEAIDIPPAAKSLSSPLITRALKSKIAKVYRPLDAELWVPDSVWLMMESGLWIGQMCTAPQGTGAAGLRIEESVSHGDLVDYWSSQV